MKIEQYENSVNTNDFCQVLLDLLLHKYRRCAGKLIVIPRGISAELDEYRDFKFYVDSEVIRGLGFYKYQYIPQRTDANQICVLDLTHGFMEYTNCIDEIEYVYDPERDEVVERVVNSKTL